MNTLTGSLADLGWHPYFQQQISLEELENTVPARVVAQHRSELEVATENGNHNFPVTPSMPQITVGDWVLLDTTGGFVRLLDRQSCFRRKTAGSQSTEQLIAANVDTAFIVCSLNEDFNLNRIERYLSLIHDAGAEPVVVLTKKDLCDDYEPYQQQVQTLGPLLSVIAVNALEPAARAALLPWCQSGRTVVLLGSSGTGKSTLTNTLLQEQKQATAAIREDDAKGRHTTTGRSLLHLPEGGMVLDTPGMRELQLVDMQSGVLATFADIEELAQQCRFTDCQHHNEPGCAVKAAVESDELDERRLTNYRKLLREQALNAASLAERRASDKALGKFYKRVMGESVKNKRGSG